ncbi:hypothetical protein KBZ10_22875 [Streptomyces sp. F63]|uniref:hypothetical protein n=1 Tax=Streptomyces sp. F63 TaxID=2824887 RepID=UPI001B3935AB|nr:hypothetical protein [Streptomyces sp. F63]MBQ0987309.1 hypothetical protein [Streptomyces sp. F63]
MAFMQEILVSLVASSVFVALAWTLSKTARRVLRGVAAHLLRLDVEEVFAGGSDVAADLTRELSKSREVAILTSRGMDLQRGPFQELWRRCQAGRCRCRILLPRLDVPTGERDWINDREEELQAFDTSFSAGQLRRQITSTHDYLAPLAAGRVEVRGYNFPHLARVVLTERAVYVTRYRADEHGWNTPVYKYRRGETYDLWTRVFTKLWQENPTG